jgi:putative flippase GtrA
MSDRLPFRDRMGRLVREAAKFGTVGALGFVVTVVVFNLCTQTAGLAPVRSGIIANAVAIATNYLGNRYWTYRHCDKSQRRREATLFVAFSCAGMAIENGVLALSHYGFDFTSPLADNVAKNVIGMGLASLFRFWSYRTWVFRRLPEPQPAGVVEEGDGAPATAAGGRPPVGVGAAGGSRSL